MRWHRDSITPGELDALRHAAERAWGSDTCHPVLAGSGGVGTGQCYVTSRWLVSRLGGYVGHRRGHFAWVSPDGRYVIDLTGDHGKQRYSYGKNEGFVPYRLVDNERTERFVKRANRIFDNLDSLLKVSLDYMGDAYPAEEPQRAEERQQQYWHDEPDASPGSGEYKFVYGNGGLEVSPSHDHRQLAEHAGLSSNHTGPVAVGWIVVSNGQATWEVQTNVNIKALERVFKDYGKQMGWKWGGITNIEGEPINDEFAPQKTSILRFAYVRDHLLLGRVSHSELLLRTANDVDDAEGNEAPKIGWIQIRGSRAEVSPIHVSAIPALTEWADDEGLVLYAGNDNVLNTIEDLEVDNLGSNSEDLDQNSNPVERDPSGLYKCPSCSRLFPRWHLYDRHRKDGCNVGADQQGGFPELDMDKPSPFEPHFTPQQPEIMPLAGYTEASRVDGFLGGYNDDDYYVAYHYGSPVGYARLRQSRLCDLHVVKEEARIPLLSKVVKYTEKQPKDLLDAPVPFIYDIQEDGIYIGHPGQRTSDIPGRFTPGGIVEGMYEPGGKVIIKSMTNMPYTVRHLVELWYYQHPELEVTGVHLKDDAGGDTKLAAGKEPEEGVSVGDYIATLVAADPAVHGAALALRQVGGNVYAVGGAVRDAVMGKEPKDIDLMVTGVPAHAVEAVLRKLPGRTDITGKDFGVFRYRQDGHEVEIALPRRERSTGERHQDFDVRADHTMSPEEDLYRRDFTANAMAVDLSNGQVIDPYNGADDIASKTLRTINANSLSEDPLRVVRALVANARHGLRPDKATKEQMAANARSLQHLPGERIQMELDKLFAAEQPTEAFRLAHETGVLRHLLPEVERCMGYDQNNPHHEHELGEHLLRVLERTCQQSEDPDLRLAALLHDIGKPDSAWVDPERGTNHYYQKKLPDGSTVGQMHELVGADLARKAMNRLRYPKDRISRVTDLIKHHMWKGFTSEKGARKFLHRVGDHADDLFALRWADQGGKTTYPTDPNLSLDIQRRLVEQVRKSQQPTNKSQLAINGNDLIAAGFPPGPQMGQILNQLTQAVIEDPRQNTRERLLQLAQGYVTI